MLILGAPVLRLQRHVGQRKLTDRYRRRSRSGAAISFATNQPSAAHVFVTPPGYKPMGPVSVYCPGGVPIEYRGW
jgi:hypothetical protein